MTGFDAFRYYMAMKLHFTTNYDAVKYNFKTGSVTSRSYEARRDRFFFEKLGSQFKNSDDLVKYYVANFVTGDINWIRDMSDANMYKHQGIIDAFMYKFLGDINSIDSESDAISLNETLKATTAYPESKLIHLYMRGSIMLQTVTCIDIHVGFINDLRKTTNDPLGVYKRAFDLIENYKPFFCQYVNIEKTRELLISRCTN